MNNDVIVLAHTRNKVEKLTADNAALERRVAADALELDKLKKIESKLKAQLVGPIQLQFLLLVSTYWSMWDKNILVILKKLENGFKFSTGCESQRSDRIGGKSWPIKQE